jgi:hypothetical protein
MAGIKVLKPKRCHEKIAEVAAAKVRTIRYFLMDLSWVLRRR